MTTARTGFNGHMTPEAVERMRELLAAGKLSVREIARRLGYSHTTIHRKRLKLGLAPPPRKAPPARPPAPTKEAARHRRRRARTAQGAAQTPSPLSAHPGTVNEAPRPVLRAPHPGILSRAEEIALVDAAIAAGIGARYEWPKGVRAPIDGVAEAMAWLDEQNIPYLVRQRGTHTEYRIDQHGGSWLPQSRFASAIRALARNRELVRVPIRPAAMTLSNSSDVNAMAM